MTLKSLISKITAYWKIITVMIGVVSSLWVAKAKYDNWVINKAEENKIEITRWQRLEKNDSVDKIFKRRIIHSLISIDSTLNQTNRVTRATRDAMTIHLKESKKYDELFQFQQDQINDLKKNE
jgi:hypothetical protein